MSLSKHIMNFNLDQGDSGGPLTVDVDGQHFLAGLTSFGMDCSLGFYGVYAEVAPFRHWIDELEPYMSSLHYVMLEHVSLLHMSVVRFGNKK